MQNTSSQNVSHLKDLKKVNITLSSIRPLPFPLSSIPHVSLISLSSDLHVYKMEGFLSPSGEISCPRLSFCMQHIKMKWEFGQTHAFPPHYRSLLCQAKKKRNSCRMFCSGCYYDLEAVCREYWTCDGGWIFFVLLFIWSSDEPSLPHAPCAIPRGFCSLQWQSVGLQPVRPWRSYSGGPTGADHRTGEPLAYLQSIAAIWAHRSRL